MPRFIKDGLKTSVSTTSPSNFSWGGCGFSRSLPCHIRRSPFWCRLPVRQFYHFAILVGFVDDDLIGKNSLIAVGYFHFCFKNPILQFSSEPGAIPQHFELDNIALAHIADDERLVFLAFQAPAQV